MWDGRHLLNSNYRNFLQKLQIESFDFIIKLALWLESKKATKSQIYYNKFDKNKIAFLIYNMFYTNTS